MFETRHLGTDGSRRNVKKFSQSDAANRSGKLGVLLDNGEEDFSLTLS